MTFFCPTSSVSTVSQNSATSWGPSVQNMSLLRTFQIQTRAGTIYRVLPRMPFPRLYLTAPCFSSSLAGIFHYLLISKSWHVPGLSWHSIYVPFSVNLSTLITLKNTNTLMIHNFIPSARNIPQHFRFTHSTVWLTSFLAYLLSYTYLYLPAY